MQEGCLVADVEIMGQLDSSKTYVQPIFRSLFEIDPTGLGWIPALLRLGNRCSRYIDVGALIQPPQLEYSADSPKDFLKWLACHPEELRWPKGYSIKSAKAIHMRKRLLAGDLDARNAFLTAVEHPPKESPKWWLLEGASRIDCALFTKNALIFIEGKRTERNASRDVSWYSGRHQVLRNLDCARAMATALNRDYYVMLITNPNHAQIGAEVVRPEVVARSLPHLNGLCDEVLRHYLGCTTWDKLVSELGRPETMLG